MDDDPPQGEPPRSDAAADRDHLRTIAFRLRELQRLLAMRVEQENRRLEAEGIDTVTETRFRPAEDE